MSPIEEQELEKQTESFAYDKLSQTLKEEPTLEILVEMSQNGEIDPWDVDLEVVTENEK